MHMQIDLNHKTQNARTKVRQISADMANPARWCKFKEITIASVRLSRSPEGYSIQRDELAEQKSVRNKPRSDREPGRWVAKRVAGHGGNCNRLCRAEGVERLIVC